ncbi:LAGLIDADG family homing endonuclease [Kitasatospora sp. NPDC002040]|uniref:LAGLIDADG family homing endonuclease n=1 Tax=Kitasatospora sp. NPDC002040 TaxID=3154661 RepID=UPI00332C5B02
MNDFDLERPEHAYMFGFIQADGHLSRGPGRKGRLTVELSARDAPLLEEFQRICPHNSTISYRTRSTNFAAEHTSVVWSVCALEFRERLQALGLPSGRKSLSVAAPTGSHSERDYIRGIVDADGSVGRTAQDLPFISLTTASEAMARYFCAYAERLTDMPRTVRRNRRDDIHNVLFTREEAVLLIRELYYPGCLALPRKQAAAGQVAAWVRPVGMKKVRKRSWTAEETELLLATPDPAAAAALLNRTVSSCEMRRWRVLGPQQARVRSPHTLA